MRVLILGASGLVGGNCMKYFREEGWDVAGTYFSYPAKGTVYFNTLNPDDERNFNVEEFCPEAIIHAGALTHVDYCEAHEEESYEKTVKTAENALHLSEKYRAKLVYISTDYVFDGTQGPYTEVAATNPISVYARHKLMAEQLVLKYEKSLAVRITNVYGDEERGKNFIARLIKASDEKETLTMKLPYDQYATPVNAYDVARALYLLLSEDKYGIYNLASTDYLNRIELAELVLKYYPNENLTIEKLSTAQLHQPAPRPLKGGLIPAKFLREFPGFRFGTAEEYLRKYSS